jgi:hypothetical protein
MDVDKGLAVFRRTSDAGALREGWFCPDCGVRIWHGTKQSPEINIKAGTLDDTSWLVTGRAHLDPLDAALLQTGEEA